MPTPIPIIAASCGDQSTTSITRVPTTAIRPRLTTIANRALSSGSPMATTPSVRNSTTAATRRPKISPAPPCSAVDQWMMSPPSATWTPPWPSSASVSSAIVLTAAASTSPAPSRNWICAKVILPSSETGAPRANGIADREHLGRLLDLRDDLLDLRAVRGVEHAAVLDREDDAGGVARLLREALGEQVVGPLGLRPRELEVVDELAGGGGPEPDGDDEGGDPEADHGAAPVVAPGGKLAHGTTLTAAPARIAPASRTLVYVLARIAVLLDRVPEQPGALQPRPPARGT